MNAKKTKQYVDSIEEVKEAFLFCREMGHMWQHVDDTNIVTTGGRNNEQFIEFTRVVSCHRCKAWREQVIDCYDFTIKKTRMIYPDAYLFSKGHRAARPEVRREVLTRVIAKRDALDRKSGS
jgi:hypothetical protein